MEYDTGGAVFLALYEYHSLREERFGKSVASSDLYEANARR